ncbi:MAG: ethanolamine ammonia-lyase reactivating factor EutA [Sedimentibacter sp.]
MQEKILSVGIDIGTSTTQLVFSHITIENTAGSFSVPRIKIVDKEVIYRSDIYFTPLLTQTKIDGKKIREIIKEEYKKAKVIPEDVKTGAVIITGETARKENANEVLQNLSIFAGNFVVATAGPDLEAIIAGKGAGADKISIEKNTYVANIDIGGGTSNIVLFKNGETIDTGCLDIGGRLIKIHSDNNKIYYIYPKIKKLAESIGVQIEIGQIAEVDTMRKIAKAMAGILEESVSVKARGPMYEKMLTNKGIKDGYNIEYITFSGGVADYIYNHDYTNPFKYGDIGVILGQEVVNSSLLKKLKLKPAYETIRATVVGASSHTTDISGSTITYTEDIFPIKNVPILKLSTDDEANFKTMEEKVREKLRWFNLDNENQQVAVAMKGPRSPTFEEILSIATALINGMSELVQRNYPIVVIMEKDIAKVLGQTIYSQLNKSNNVVCIDNVKVENGDYIDIGKPLVNGNVVPVVIKTLLFNS